MRTGRAEDALNAFAEAVTRLDEHPEPQARVLLNRGNVYLQQGDATRAASDFTDAANRFDEAGITVERAKSRFNLGYVELLRGDLVAALRGMDDARDVLAPLSPAYRATVEQDRAEVLMAAGMSHEAARALEAASSAYGTQRLRRFQADCELTLAQTLLRGDPARARVVARRAARRFRTQGGELPALQADAVAAVAEVAMGGRSPRSVAASTSWPAPSRRATTHGTRCRSVCRRSDWPPRSATSTTPPSGCAGRGCATGTRSPYACTGGRCRPSSPRPAAGHGWPAGTSGPG